MQRTADFHHHVANPGFPQPDGLFEHAAAFDAAVDMFDAHAPPRDLPIARFLGSRQRFSTWLLHRLNDLHAVQRERLKAQVLQQLTPGRQWIGRGVGDALVMHTTRMSFTQEQNTQSGIDQQDVFEHMPLFLAAITRFLFSRVVGARDGSLGTIMTKRGATGGVAGWTASAGEGSSGRCGNSTPRRSHKASTRRQGASPKARRVLRNTGSKT
jgi:hypothetical protein